MQGLAVLTKSTLIKTVTPTRARAHTHTHTHRGQRGRERERERRLTWTLILADMSVQELAGLKGLRELRIDMPEEGTVQINLARALSKLSKLQLVSLRNMGSVRGLEVTAPSLSLETHILVPRLPSSLLLFFVSLIFRHH
jgi:hypothetical protein